MLLPDGGRDLTDVDFGPSESEDCRGSEPRPSMPSVLGRTSITRVEMVHYVTYGNILTRTNSSFTRK